MADVLCGVVVVHFGDATPTRACLDSILSDPSPVARSVVLVDNSCSFTKAPEGIALISCRENPGFGEGANRGVAALPHADYAAYVVLNHDIRLEPGFLAAAVRALKSSANVGAVGGPIRARHDDNRLWYAGGGVCHLTGTVYQKKTEKWAVRRRPVGFIPGAALALRPAAWRQVGGFDPHYFLYNEDLDLCLRLRDAGWRLVFEPDMKAVHALGSATGSDQASPLYLEWLARNRFRPFPSRTYRVYLAMIHTAFVAARASYHLLTDPRSGREAALALWRGHRSAVAGLFHR